MIGSTEIADVRAKRKAESASAPGPLAGVRVIEVGAFIAGPYCGQLLADLGADVIKIEPPGMGDPMRHWGQSKSGRSLWWPVIARNKRCITLDLRVPSGQALVRRLIAQSDVLVENLRPGTLEKWSLDPMSLRASNPKLVVARVSGFGQTGPYRDLPGFAAVCEAMAGFRTLTGYPDRAPVRAGLSIGDSLAGLFAVLAVLCALFDRDRVNGTGAGQEADIGITDSVLAVMESVISEYSATGQVRRRTGTVLPGLAPSNLYPTLDNSYVVIAANSDKLFRALASVMACPELSCDSRFETHEARGQNQDELDRLIAEWTTRRTEKQIVSALKGAGIPVGPVYDAADVTGDPHFRERESIVDVDVEGAGVISMQGVVPRFSRTPGKIRWTGPPLGEHNREIYIDLLGLSEAELKELKKQETI